MDSPLFSPPCRQPTHRSDQKSTPSPGASRLCPSGKSSLGARFCWRGPGRARASRAAPQEQPSARPPPARNRRAADGPGIQQGWKVSPPKSRAAQNQTNELTVPKKTAPGKHRQQHTDGGPSPGALRPPYTRFSASTQPDAHSWLESVPQHQVLPRASSFTR